MTALKNLGLLKEELIKRGMAESIINAYERKSDGKAFMFVNYSKHICIVYSNNEYKLDGGICDFTKSIEKAADIIIKAATELNNGSITEKWDNPAYVSYLDTLPSKSEKSDWKLDDLTKGAIYEEAKACAERYHSGIEYALVKAKLKEKVEKIVPKNAPDCEWDEAITFAYNALSGLTD